MGVISRQPCLPPVRDKRNEPKRPMIRISLDGVPDKRNEPKRPMIGISLDGVRDKNVMQLKKLNTALFPVRHNEGYYADALASGEFSKLAYYGDNCVGAIACRLEKKESGAAICVYIMTLGVLAPYRGQGIGSKLLKHVLDLCSKQNIGEVYLHVQTDNDDAIKFCTKFGFQVTGIIPNY